MPSPHAEPAVRASADLDPAVVEACRELLAKGSKSFHAASRLLPARLRDPVAAFYAFCRVSDDAVDESEVPTEALAALHRRLDRIYAGRPDDHPADRGLAWVTASYDIPRALLDALLDGYAWDVEGRRYEDLSSVIGYSARVASSVGVVMTLLMGPRERDTLRRAAAMGAAMQLTNIARDVGEDARMGRVYLPEAWLREEGLSAEALLRDPTYSDGVGVTVCRLLDAADRLYRQADPGVALLPPDCRTAIRAARLIYGDIGRVVRATGYDSVSRRAFTSRWRKAQLLAKALPARVFPPGSQGPSPVLRETEFLVEAVAGPETTWN